MRPLQLYTAFHGNLDFSALPDADRPVVIARCYWPLLALPERYGIPIGFEMSARTLQALEREDPEWVKRFRGLAERGLVEPIASGWAQVVAPLAPVEVNRANLELGTEAYREVYGFEPSTFFVHEQTFSDGLVPLLAEAGARRVIMEWNNPAASQPALRPLRCQPARLAGPPDPGPVLLWNDSIVFQKLQRYAHGEIPVAEIDALIDRVVGMPGAQALCIYGGDVEIFDYRPSRPVGSVEGEPLEIERLIGFLRRLASDPRFEFVLPRDVVDEPSVLPEVRLGSASDPLPCKKQPRYNPTRWAVSGRDGFGMNTRCHELLRTRRAALRIGGAGESATEWRELVDLWRSDFRTRATEEKIAEFDTGMGLATERSRARLEELAPTLEEGVDLVLSNPWELDWDGQPVEVPLRLAVGRCFDLRLRGSADAPLDEAGHQLEVAARHRDGSIRDATLVLEPRLAAGARLSLRLEACARGPAARASRESVEHASSEGVEAEFLPHRGAALARVTFPGVSDASLLGTIFHGTFDEIAYTPDFYSGHVVAISETGEKITDLRRVALRPVPEATGAVRATFEACLDTSLGSWRKRFRLYRHRPRLDVTHVLGFHEARLASLRLGAMTLLPEGWRRDGLRFGTRNGGDRVEWRSLAPGVRITQSAAVSSTVSATSCLGATEGWVAFEDGEKGVIVEGERAGAAVVPMLDFRDVDDRFFGRLLHSAAETDETRATFLRGQRRFGFAIEGYRVDGADAIAEAGLRSRGLVYRTEQGVGLTRSL